MSSLKRQIPTNFPNQTWVRATGAMTLVSLLLPTTIAPAMAVTPSVTPSAPSFQPRFAANSTTTNVSNNYILGPGDRLKAEFFNIPEFSQEYQVLPNGTLNMPRIGAVKVDGMSLRQASAVIGGRYRRYLTRPIITLSLIAGRPVQVAIGGEINRSGAYNMSSGLLNANTVNNTVNVPTLTQLIRQAEGVTQAADLSKVIITSRYTGQRTVNLWDFLDSNDRVVNAGFAQLDRQKNDVRLQDGDKIFIPSIKTIDKAVARKLTKINLATTSNRPLRIAIVGEVNRPGPYTIFEGEQQADGRTATPNSVAPTITKALQVAGGITQQADLTNIKVYRLTYKEKDNVRAVGASNIQTKIPPAEVNFLNLLRFGDVLEDLPLQDGDRIVIGKAAPNQNDLTEIARASFSPDKIAINVVGEVERPGSITVLPNAPLNQGILAAGGFNRRARKKSVTLVRLQPNGTVSKREIDVDFSKGINDKNNPSLRAGDTIIVQRHGLAGVGDSLGILSAPITGAFSVLRLLGIVR